MVGPSGEGKTYLARQIVKNDERLIVADFIADPAPEGWEASCGVVHTWDALLREIRNDRFRIAVQIEEDPEATLNQLCELVRTVDSRGNPAVGPVTLVIEEVSIPIQNPRARPSDELQGLVRFSRREWVSWMFITQCYMDCPKIVRDHVQDLYVFRTSDHNDLKKHRSTYGATVANELFFLPRYSYCHFSKRRGTPVVVSGDGKRRPLELELRKGVPR